MKRLENLIDEFSDAIVFCDSNARICLYNNPAVKLFRNVSALNIGHSLYGLFHRTPFDHAYRELHPSSEPTSQLHLENKESWFICSTLHDANLLMCHMRLIVSEDDAEFGYVLTFSQLKKRIDEAAQKGISLSTMIEDLRSPLANLNAAAENLKNNPGLPELERRNFENIIASESADLMKRFAAVVTESQTLTLCEWPLSEVYSADLIRCVIHRLAQRSNCKFFMTGIPVWLQADPYSMSLALETLILAVQKENNAVTIDIEAVPWEKGVYFDIVWEGHPVAQDRVDLWFHIPLPVLSANMTVAHVLKRHNSDIWSQNHRRPRYALLRIPVPASQKKWERPLHLCTNRPAYFEYYLKEMGNRKEAIDTTPLTALSYVVFRTETMGEPHDDESEILAIAAVRIVDGRILCGDTFLTLVNPNRPIPDNIAAMHGIDNNRVKGEPPIIVAFSDFKSFVDDCVLVSHHAGFDMQFIHRVEEKTDIRLDSIILDTQLLSHAVGEQIVSPPPCPTDKDDHVPMQRRATLMSECFTTAKIFLDILESLERIGTTTLADALILSKKMAQERSN